MERRLNATLDHVAIAVPDADVAAQRWRDELGGGSVAREQHATFGVWQLRYAGDGKLELLSPPASADGFVARFLQRFGSTVHHVTLKVPDLPAALDTVAAAGLEAVDVRTDSPWWHEAFLRPSQVGGLVVQIAWSPASDDDWARRVGVVPAAPRSGAVTLHGPTLRHPDLDRAAALWSLLGATVEPEGGRLRCTWPDSVLDVHVRSGEPAGPVGLRASGCGSLEADPALGPLVEAR